MAKKWAVQVLIKEKGESPKRDWYFFDLGKKSTKDDAIDTLYENYPWLLWKSRKEFKVLNVIEKRLIRKRLHKVI